MILIRQVEKKRTRKRKRNDNNKNLFIIYIYIINYKMTSLGPYIEITDIKHKYTFSNIKKDIIFNYFQ